MRNQSFPLKTSPQGKFGWSLCQGLWMLCSDIWCLGSGRFPDLSALADLISVSYLVNRPLLTVGLTPLGRGLCVPCPSFLFLYRQSVSRGPLFSGLFPFLLTDKIEISDSLAVSQHLLRSHWSTFLSLAFLLRTSHWSLRYSVSKMVWHSHHHYSLSVTFVG